jgi:hypothetical protein
MYWPWFLFGINHYFIPRTNFTAAIAFIISTDSLGHASAHCLKFLTAAG